jgi:hypothetical protein
MFVPHRDAGIREPPFGAAAAGSRPQSCLAPETIASPVVAHAERTVRCTVAPEVRGGQGHSLGLPMQPPSRTCARCRAYVWIDPSRNGRLSGKATQQGLAASGRIGAAERLALRPRGT